MGLVGITKPAPERAAGRLVKWVIAGFALFVVVRCVMTTNDATRVAVPERIKTPAQVAEELRMQRVAAVLRSAKAASKDPESFELVQAALVGQTTLCVMLRGKNSFGAKVVQNLAWTLDGKALDYNKNCSGKSGDDVSAAKHMM